MAKITNQAAMTIPQHKTLLSFYKQHVGGILEKETLTYEITAAKKALDKATVGGGEENIRSLNEYISELEHLKYHE